MEIKEIVLVCKGCGYVRTLPVMDENVTSFLAFLGICLTQPCPECEEKTSFDWEKEEDWEETHDSILAQKELEDFEGLTFYDDMAAYELEVEEALFLEE